MGEAKPTIPFVPAHPCAIKRQGFVMSSIVSSSRLRRPLSMWCLPWLAWCVCATTWAATDRRTPTKPEDRPIIIGPDVIDRPKPRVRKKSRVIQLPKIKVKRKRSNAREGAKDPSGFVTVIDAKQAAKRVRDLKDIVRESAGVQLRSLGGMGSFGAISIRGSTPSQVQILLDGVPINSGSAGVIDLGALPVDALDNITIFRGFMPAHLGGSMGGAIALTTRFPRGFQATSFAASVGSFQTLKLNASHARRFGRWQMLAYGQFLSNGGGFRYYDDRGTSLTTDDDIPNAYRANNALISGFGLLRVQGVLHPKVRLGLTNVFTARQQGLPGIGNFRSTTASLRHLRNLFQATLDVRQWPITLMRSTHQLYLVVQADRYSDLDGEIGLGRQHTDNSSHIFGWKFHWQYLPLPFWSISFSSTLRQEGFVAYDLQKSPAANQSPVSSRLQWDPVLQTTFSFWNEKLIILAAGRATVIEHSRKAGNDGIPLTDGFVPGVLAQPMGRIGMTGHPFSWLWLKANAGRYVRVPTFYELFGDRGAVMGNPRLRSEAGWMWDAGAVIRWQNRGLLDEFRLGYAFFWTSSERLIRFVQNSQRTSIAINIDAAQITGHEVRMKLGFARWVQMQVELTYMDARNLSGAPFENGKRLPGRPEGEFFVRLAITRPWARIFYDYRYTTSNVLDRANLRELAPRQIHNVGIALMPGKLLRRLGVPVVWDGLTVTVELKNLFDARTELVPLRPPLPNLTEIPQAIADYSGFPLPGRSVYLTVHWRM